MAPEQARGEHVDQRADIYAFGLILYDMLAGRRRVDHAPSAVLELQKRMAQPPASIRSIVPQVPDALDKLVTRCIEPDAEKRFQSAAELVAALDRLDDNGKLRPIKKVIGLPIAVAVGLALLIPSGAIWYFTRPPVQHDPVYVVIADVENRTKDPAFDGVLEPMMEPRPGGRRIHHGVRSRRDQAPPAYRGSGGVRRGRRARPRCQAGARRRARGHHRALRTRLPNLRQSHSIGDGRHDHEHRGRRHEQR